MGSLKKRGFVEKKLIAVECVNCFNINYLPEKEAMNMEKKCAMPDCGKCLHVKEGD